MDIGFYMTDLLRDQDEVSLPGLGTFTKVRVPGSYDQTTNSFLPPGHQVSFTAVTKESNSLSEYISDKKSLSRSSSEYFVKKFTSTLFDLLQTSGIAEIKPLGILRQQDDTLLFEASGKIDISGQFYGLRPVSDLEKRFYPAPDTEGVVEEITIPELNLKIGEEEAESEERGNKSKFWILGTFLFLLIAAGLLYAFNPIVNDFLQGLFAPAVSRPVSTKTVTINKNTPAIIPDSAGTETAIVLADSTVADSLGLSQPAVAAEPNSATYTEPTFEIIGVVFQKKEEADIYIKQLAAKGIAAKIATQIPGKLVKVSLGSFPDEQSALVELRRIHKEINKEAWIYRPKLKKTN